MSGHHGGHEHHHEDERIEVEVLTTKRLKPINDARRFAFYSIGCFSAITVSFSYAFNLISHDMQKLLNLTLRDLSDINTVGNTMQYGAFFYSIIYDYIGPIVPITIGAVTFALGTILLALSFRRTIRPTLVRLCVFNGIMSVAFLAFDLCANVTVTTHFPTARGLMIPLLKSYVGLGSAIVGTIQLAFFTNPEYFFYFLAALATVAAVLMGAIVEQPRYQMTGYQLKHLSEEEKAERTASKAQYLRQKPAKWRLIYSFVILGVLIVFLPTQSAVLNYLHLGKRYKIGFAITTIVLVLLLTVVSIPMPSDRKTQEESVNEHSSQEKEREAVHELDDLALADKDPVDEAVEPQPKETIVDYIAPQYQFSFMRSLLTLRYWALLWSLFCFGGTETTVISYSSYIYGSIDGKPVDPNLTTLLSVLNGVGSAVGRLLIALFEHLTQNRPPEKRIPMTWSPMIPSVLLTIALILFLSIRGSALPLPFVILAIANGSQAAQTALLPRTIYAKDVGKHYQFCFVASLCSSIVVVRFLFAEWYTRQSAHSGNGKGYCFGKRCTLMPFCVMLGLVCTTYFSNLYVCWRYWQYCAKVLAERARLREQPMATQEGGNGSEVDYSHPNEMIQSPSKVVLDDIEGSVENSDPNKN